MKQRIVQFLQAGDNLFVFMTGAVFYLVMADCVFISNVSPLIRALSASAIGGFVGGFLSCGVFKQKVNWILFLFTAPVAVVQMANDVQAILASIIVGAIIGAVLSFGLKMLGMKQS